ncbi:MAG TPA: hypothetical protein VEW04_11515 [Allosphingosinicella sp.]|nr:hypothetical protein [Allosphingosinicella sp.]
MTEILMTRRFSRLAALLGLALAGASAHAQDAPSPGVTGAATQGDTGGAPGAVAEPAPAAPHSRGEIHPYLEVAQTLTADLNGGDTLTYTSFAVGVDGHVEAHRIAAQFGVRYQQNVEWSGDLPNNSMLSGVAQAHLDVAPNLLSFDVGAMATHTAGEGRALGATTQDAAVNVYSFYAGPTLSTYAGPVAINASYRFGYVKVDDDRNLPNNLDEVFDDSTVHSFTASIGMGTNAGLPFGWTIGGGYGREDSGGIFGNRFEGAYIRGDVVFPVSPTFALTAGIGYEDLESSQYDFVRDASGNVVIGANGLPVPNPNAPRLLTYQMDDVMYDAGFIWRPGPRTELQARAGHRYGGTTFTGSLSHQLNSHEAINAVVFDTVETFGRQVSTNISALPSNANINIDPLTGSLSGCVFGANGGGTCLTDTLQSISPSTFRARGGNIIFAGSRGLWNYGMGAGYTHHRYFLPTSPVNVAFASEDETYGVSASIGRQLTRVSNVNVSAYASWYDRDAAAFQEVTTVGTTISYDHRFMLDRLQLLAALGLYNSNNGIDDTAVFSALVGLRYTF